MKKYLSPDTGLPLENIDIEVVANALTGEASLQTFKNEFDDQGYVVRKHTDLYLRFRESKVTGQLERDSKGKLTFTLEISEQ